jgi:hypothetical protein
MTRWYTDEERLRLFKERNIIVDDEDLWWATSFTWRHDKDGYAIATYHGHGIIKLHLCIMGQPLWEEDEVDHIDRNRLNNRRGNLRWVNRYQQRHNSALVLDATNIRQRKEGGSYTVKVRRNGILHEQVFKTLEEAITARDVWRQT